MKRLTDLIARLKSIDAAIIEVIRKTLQENKALILDMNTEGQLFEKGVNRLNVEIDTFAPYHPETVRIKIEKGQPTNRVTLRDEGDFHSSFTVEFTNTGFEIKANDWKAKGLISKYGESILGLTNENFNELARHYIAPEISKLFKAL